ncbi:hypothetical protein [Xanthovirga aplysinae]|uniref:hypothetical protein n=1 Tax=Xanthovirga aplysinae TaxID=2529853 RepID=UPI0012BBE18E|nr:hypothetical protein [Xanthovirga aplysinae]MTI31408.1 hypothetical protein [Xanthovirga aplysinae]
MKKLFSLTCIFFSLVLLYSCKDDGVDLNVPKPFTTENIDYMLSVNDVKTWQRVSREENGQLVEFSEEETGALLNFADTAVDERKDILFELPNKPDNEDEFFNELTSGLDSLYGTWDVEAPINTLETANQLTFDLLNNSDLKVTFTIEEITSQHLIFTFPAFEFYKEGEDTKLRLKEGITVKEEYQALSL